MASRSTQRRVLRELALIGLTGIVLSAPAPGAQISQQLPAWPAESEQEAVNLSSLDSAFSKDLSGATWNPIQRSLWLCRNGPKGDSRLWSLVESKPGEWSIARRQNAPAIWRGLGDWEGLTFADESKNILFLIVEGEERIHEVDLDSAGVAKIRRIYDTSPFLPLKGKAGAEGITFVPDAHLSQLEQQSDVGEKGVKLPASTQGMQGLMLVGHQNGGGIFAFDLDPDTGRVQLAGEFRVRSSEDPAAFLSKVVGLEFDRSTGLLWIWHGLKKRNVLSIVELRASAVAGKSFRSLAVVACHEGPSDRSYEGIAIVPTANSHPSLFLTVDDGGESALLRYDNFPSPRQ